MSGGDDSIGRESRLETARLSVSHSVFTFVSLDSFSNGERNMKRTYLRRPGSQPPGRPKKTPEVKEWQGTLNKTKERRMLQHPTAAPPAAHPAPTVSAPRRDRDGDIIDESAVLSDEAEARLCLGLSADAREVLMNLTDMFWEWPRQRQIVLRAFAECAATIRAFGSPKRGSVQDAKLQEQRLILSSLAEQLYLSAAEVLVACEKGKGSKREGDRAGAPH
jgi:hypothetical protein